MHFSRRGAAAGVTFTESSIAACRWVRTAGVVGDSPIPRNVVVIMVRGEGREGDVMEEVPRVTEVDGGDVDEMSPELSHNGRSTVQLLCGSTEPTRHGED